MKRYYRTATNWLHRVDVEPVLDAAEAKGHAEAEYALVGVEVVEREDDLDPREGVLLYPPANLLPRPPDPNAPFHRDLDLAVTLDDVKAALKARFPLATVEVVTN